MDIKDLDFQIPRELIALYPKKPRHDSNLLIVDEKYKIVKFKEIIHLLHPGDAIVFNNTKVIYADFDGFINNRKISINLNKVEDKKKNIWSVFIKTKKKLKVGDNIKIFNRYFANVKKLNNEVIFLKFTLSYIKLKEQMKKYGRAPLPPYIKKRGHKKSDFSDYQSVFAKNYGAVAAPTASLHFTNELIKELEKKKIKIIKVTLHVNGGTFIPIRDDNIIKHSMHYEEGFISKRSAEEINKIKNKGGRIIAVGTTVLRLLESSKDETGHIKPFKADTNIFIKPGWKINTIDGIITNFHTPRSTLLLLVFAIIGKRKTHQLYNFAVKKKMRFFSYGDACLIWRKNEKY